VRVAEEEGGRKRGMDGEGKVRGREVRRK